MFCMYRFFFLKHFKFYPHFVRIFLVRAWRHIAHDLAFTEKSLGSIQSRSLRKKTHGWFASLKCARNGPILYLSMKKNVLIIKKNQQPLLLIYNILIVELIVVIQIHLSEADSCRIKVFMSCMHRIYLKERIKNNEMNVKNRLKRKYQV